MKRLKEPRYTAEDRVAEQRSVESAVKEIIEQVRSGGDEALLELTRKFDGVDLDEIRVTEREIRAAYDKVDPVSLEMVKKAASNIELFASRQLESIKELEFEKIPGVTLGHRLVPLENVGCYVPAGRYPLPSSAMMSIIPARVAGVKRIAACAPPSGDFKGIHPLVLVGMDIAGADEIYAMGGAQAVAAYRYGTETVAPTVMVVGPGNRYVVEAKRRLGGEIGIDLLAGPSEVLIIADKSADPKTVAVDLLAKCEHDPEAVAVLVTTSEALGREVLSALEAALVGLETAAIAAASWEKHGEIIVAADYAEAVEIANEMAPEHLQLMTADDDSLVPGLINYGSLFIGGHAPVAFGDYCSGTNHTLPTGRSAKFSGGLWVGSYIRVLSYQKISRKGASALAPICSHLAEKEGLYAHRASSELRK